MPDNPSIIAAKEAFKRSIELGRQRRAEIDSIRRRRELEIQPLIQAANKYHQIHNDIIIKNRTKKMKKLLEELIVLLIIYNIVQTLI